MYFTRVLTAAAVTLAAGAAAQAGPFDMLLGRRPKPVEPDAAQRVALNDRSEIGQFVSPVSYQPGVPQPALTPVPEGYSVGPATGAPPAYYAPTPAYGAQYQPGVPMGAYPAAPYGGEVYPSGPYPVGPDGGMPLYSNVKYKDLDNIHPCAVTKIIQVLDPCAERNPCLSCGPQCVFVRICVPPGECERVSVSRNGRKVKYKYDDYQVEVESKDGYVEVDYDD